MDRTKWTSVAGLVIGTILLCRSAPTTFALDKVVHTCIFMLACVGATITAISRLLPKENGRSHKGQQYDAVPLGEVNGHGSTNGSIGLYSNDDVIHSGSLRGPRAVFFLLIVMLCARMEILRQVVAHVQCATVSWEPLIPLSFALWDYVSVQRYSPPRRAVDEPDSSVYDVVQAYWLGARYRYVLSTSVMCVASMLAIYLSVSPASTVICAASMSHRWLVPLMQHVGTLLDVGILGCISHLLSQQNAHGQRSAAVRFASVGWSLLLSSTALLLIGSVYYTLQRNDRKWIATIPNWYFWSVLRMSVSLSFTAVCATFCVCYGTW
jgi:hypothetical protein